MKRDLGELGESTLTRWAAARGISAQKARKDRTGWDYILEFPSRWAGELSPIPRDREPASISCLVQVKATSTRNLNPSVKLTNWQRLITNPLPAFFLILDFRSGDLPRAAYLVPVDELRISQALRRIRELDSRSEDIAGRSLRVVCGEADRLPIPNGESLEKAILNHVGPSLEEYLERKRGWVKTTGYETTRGSFTIGISADSLQGASIGEYFVDLSLGLRTTLPITHAEFRDIRFNIPARLPRRLPAGEIEIIRQPPEHVEVTLSRGISVVRTTMDMFLPHGLGEVVGADLLKVLFRSKLFDFVLSDLATHNNSLSVCFHIPDSEAREKLSAFYDLARVVLLFEENARLGGEICCNIRSDVQVLSQGKLDAHGGIKPEIVELAKIVRDAWAVAKHLEIHDRVEPTATELLSQNMRFCLFRNLLAANNCMFKVGGFVDDTRWADGARVCVPFGTEVILGDYRGTVVVSLFGDVKHTGRKEEGMVEFEIVSSERRVETVFATGRDEEPSMSLSAAVRTVAEAQNSLPCLLLPQYVEDLVEDH